MIEYMRHVKNTHLNLIKNEARKYLQVGEIEMGEITEHIGELEDMAKDIRDNMNSIVKEIS